MEYTKGTTIKSLIADKLVQCDTHFENDQLVAILDICDEVGIPDLYVALKDVGLELRINDSTWGHGIFIRLSDWKEHYEPIIAKAEGK